MIIPQATCTVHACELILYIKRICKYASQVGRAAFDRLFFYCLFLGKESIKKEECSGLTEYLSLNGL